jgi:basic membrane protein A and related proteins
MTNASKRSYRLATGIVTATLIGLIAGCGGGGGSNTSATGASTGSAKPQKVAMILVGPKNDKGFDQGAYDGALQVIHNNPQLKLTAVLENRLAPAQVVDAVNTLAPINNIVIGVGGTSGQTFDAEADKYKNTTFLTIQGPNPAHYHKNVYSLVWDPYTPYVAGAIAATLNKSGVVGALGGADIPATVKSVASFNAGARTTKPGIKVLNNIIGDFNDVSKAKAAAGAMITDRADVIYPFLDAGVVGVYAAAHGANKLIPVFKLDFQDCTTYQNMVGVDIFEDTHAGTAQLLQQVVAGKLTPPGVAVFARLQDPRLSRLDLCPRYASDKQVSQVVQKTVAGLKSGQIKVPANVPYPRPPYPYRESFSGPVQNAGKTG